MILSELIGYDKAHWELHLKAAQKDLPDSKEVTDFLASKIILPDLAHPSFIHDWLEKPKERAELEAING